MSGIVGSRNNLRGHIARGVLLSPFYLERMRSCFGTRKFGCRQPRVVRYFVTMNKVTCCLSLFRDSGDITRGVRRLYFAHNNRLARRFSHLFGSLFGGTSGCRTVMATLGSGNGNVAERRLLSTARLPGGNEFADVLGRLRRYSFVHDCGPFKGAGGRYVCRLVSPFALFCFGFVRGGNAFFSSC